MSVLSFGIDAPLCVEVACVVRAATESPGLARFESTGLVSTALTDDPFARLSPAELGGEAFDEAAPDWLAVDRVAAAWLEEVDDPVACAEAAALP